LLDNRWGVWYYLNGVMVTNLMVGVEAEVFSPLLFLVRCSAKGSGFLFFADLRV